MSLNGETSTGTSAVRSLTAADEQLFKGLIDSVKTLSSQDDYKLVNNCFTEIERLRQELRDSKRDFAAHASLTTDLAKEKLSLQEQLDQGQEAITSLVEEKADLEKSVQKLEESSNKQRNTIEKAKGKVKEQVADLKAKTERIQKLEEKLKHAENQVVELERGSSSLRGEYEALVQRHSADAERAEELEGMAIKLLERDSDAVASEFRQLWKNAEGLVLSHFKHDLPELGFQNNTTWDRLMDPEFISHHVPLPRTNSLAAKRMRIAVILAIIATSLDTYIFHPTYLFGEESGVREVLRRLAVYDSRKESFLRGLLLSLFSDELEDAANERIDSTTEFVMSHVHGLLAGPQEEEFQDGVNLLARQGYETWAKIRSTKERYEPNFDIAHEADFEWDTLRFDADLVGPDEQRTAIQGGRDDEILVVFPRLYVIEKNQPPRLIADGAVLRRSQSLAAAQESEGPQTATPSSPTFGRTTSARLKARRMRDMPGLWNENRSSDSYRFLE